MNSWGWVYYFSSSMCFELCLNHFPLCGSVCVCMFECKCLCVFTCVYVCVCALNVSGRSWCFKMNSSCLLQGDQGDQGPRVCGLLRLLVLFWLADECHLVLLYVSLSRIVGKRFEIHGIPGILFSLHSQTQQDFLFEKQSWLGQTTNIIQKQWIEILLGHAKMFIFDIVACSNSGSSGRLMLNRIATKIKTLTLSPSL